MKRFALGCVLLAAACGGKSSGSGGGSGSGIGSICTGAAAPAVCGTSCDPQSGTGDATCGAGFHCASGGKCDAQCTPTGGECGPGMVCTNDGFCNVDDGTGGGDDTPPIDANCPSLQFTVTRVTPSVEILLDRSGSMQKDFPGNDRVDAKGNPIDPSQPPAERFYTEQQALVGPNGIVTQLQDSVYFGAAMYPGPMCPNGSIYSTPRAISNAQAIATMIAANRPDGNTPTAAAIDSVVADFVAHPPPANSPPVIVLASDGLPNQCGGTEDNDQAKAIASAKNAFSKGIKLYLLTVGFEITDQFKQDLANAGQGVQPGQPNATAYSATDPASMAAAFQAIIGGVVSCDLKLNGMVMADYANTGVVVLNGKTLTYMTDWTLDASGTAIKLSDAQCQTLKTTTNPTISATFACGSGMIFF